MVSDPPPHFSVSAQPSRPHAVVVLTSEDLGREIRARRKTLRLTQDEIALDAGITRQRLGELERGKVGIHLEVALRVCKSLGLRIQVGGLT